MKGFRRPDRPLWQWLPSLGLTVLFVYVLRHLFQSGHVYLAAGNTFEVADWICLEGLDILTNAMEVASKFSTDYEVDFEREYPVGDTVRVPLKTRGVIRNGLAYSGAPIVRKHTTVTVSEVFGMDFDIDSVERALRVGRSKEWVSEEIIAPYMVQIAQEWDQRAAKYAALNTPNMTGTLGTDPTTFAATTTAYRQMMMELGGMQGTTLKNRGAFIPPSVMANLRMNTATAFNPTEDITEAFHEGYYSRADGFKVYESMSLLSYTSGTWASPAGLTVKTSSVTGDTTLVVNCTTGDVFNQGDIVQVTGRFRVNPITRQKIGARNLTMVVTAQTTGAASAATLPIAIGPFGLEGPGSPYQNVDSLPVVNDVVTMFPGATFSANTAKTGNQALALNKDAFLLVGVPLELPKKGAEIAAQHRDENTGIAIRLTKTWDAVQSRMIHRLDTVGGFGIGWADVRAVRGMCA